MKDVKIKGWYESREDNFFLVCALFAEVIVNPNRENRPDQENGSEVRDALMVMYKDLRATNLASGSATVKGYVIHYFGDGNYVTFSIIGKR